MGFIESSADIRIPTAQPFLFIALVARAYIAFFYTVLRSHPALAKEKKNSSYTRFMLLTEALAYFLRFFSLSLSLFTVSLRSRVVAIQLPFLHCGGKIFPAREIIFMGSSRFHQIGETKIQLRKNTRLFTNLTQKTRTRWNRDSKEKKSLFYELGSLRTARTKLIDISRQQKQMQQRLLHRKIIHCCGLAVYGPY